MTHDVFGDAGIGDAVHATLVEVLLVLSGQKSAYPNKQQTKYRFYSHIFYSIGQKSGASPTDPFFSLQSTHSILVVPNLASESGKVTLAR